MTPSPNPLRDPHLFGALSYLLGLISGIVMLVIEKDNAYVRFHAMQSVLTFTGVAVVYVLLPTVPLVGDFTPLRAVYGVSVIGLWGLLMWKAVQGEKYRVPYLGDLAESLVSK
jgi:uncharacterized membrane protein